MRTSIDATTLAAVTIAAALTVSYTPGEFNLWDLAIGLALTILLVSYNTGRHRRRWQSAAFASVVALPLTIIIGSVLQWLKLKPEWWWLPAAWAISFLVVYLIDRLRNEPDDNEQVMPSYIRHAAPLRRPDPIRPRPRPVPAHRPPPRRRPLPEREDEDETLCSPFCWCDC